MTKIFTNPPALEEGIDNAILSSKQSAEAKRLKGKLDGWLIQNNSKIIAYIGRFGSGKSTVLNQVRETYRKEHEVKWWKIFLPKESRAIAPLWFDFEAWRYADRGQLWDGFVIEVERYIKGDESRAQRLVDGRSRTENTPVRLAIVLLVLGIWLAASHGLWYWLHDSHGYWETFFTATLKYSISVPFVVLAFAGITSLFSSKRPLKRVYELEEVLARSLKKLKRPLVVVVEDVDRAGDEGVVFLETLRHFLSTHAGIKHSVIIIAPQGLTYMSTQNEDKVKGLERGIKTYDLAMYYDSSSLQSGDTTKLLDNAGIKAEYREEVVAVTGAAIRKYKDQLSLRTLKFIFRELHEFGDPQDNIKPGLALLLIITRYIKADEKFGKNGTVLDVLGKHRMLQKSSSSGDLNFLHTQMISLSELTDMDKEAIYLKYDGKDSEISAGYRDYDQKTNIRRGVHMTLHERYLALLSI